MNETAHLIHWQQPEKNDFAIAEEVTLKDILELTLRIDEAVRRERSEGWRGVQTRENEIKGALFNILHNTSEVERIFIIIKQQKEY